MSDCAEINFRARHIVDQVGEEILGHGGNDLDDLRIGETGCAHHINILLRYLTPPLSHAAGKADGSGVLGFGGLALQREGDVFMAQLGKGEAGEAVRGIAIFAAIDPVPENASSGNERNLAKLKVIGAGDFA